MSGKSARQKSGAVLALSKAPTGISALDEITQGGLPRGRTTLVRGGTGSGKTMLGVAFLVRGAQQFGEPGVLALFEETAGEASVNVASLGFDLPALERAKLLSIDHIGVRTSVFEASGAYDLDGLFVRLGLAIDEVGAKRVVLDTIEALFSLFSSERILRSEIHRLFRWLNDRGMTSVVTGERGDGSMAHGLQEYESDCVFLLDQWLDRQTMTRRLRVSPRPIRVDLNSHGAWEIKLPGQLDPINCESLYEAKRAAYRFAADWRPCEIVVCDAYHRVVHRNFIDRYEDAAAYSDQERGTSRESPCRSCLLVDGWHELWLSAAEGAGEVVVEDLGSDLEQEAPTHPAHRTETRSVRADVVIDEPTSGVRGRRHGDTATGRAERAFVAALRVGDPHAAVAVVDRAVQNGLSSMEIQSRVIAPAMWEIGELWERGALTVAQEHLATAVSHHVLTRLYPVSQRQDSSGTVVVAGVQGEHHVLGLRMAADVFEGAGFDVRFLGADVPQNSLLALVAEHQPAIVVLGVTMALNAAALIRNLQALRDRDPALQLVAGGQGVPTVLRHSTGVFFAADTEQLADYAAGACHAPAQGELPAGIATGGVGFGSFVDGLPALTGGLEARFAETVAAAADAARGHARRAVALEQIALRDPLTQLWNRRAFDDRYQALVEDPVARAPAILMIDVDHFKAVNDRFGHDAGDLALISVARCITSALRPSDFAVRYGGDEFVVLLPDTPLELAAEISERIRAQVEHDLTDPQLTISIGISGAGHTDRRRATLDADHALYEAKEHGRNQTALA